MIDVVLCDDHALVRRGIRDTLAEAPDIHIRGEAGSYPELREVLRNNPCDVLLLDINLPGRNGLEALESLCKTHPYIKILVVSMYPEDQYALRCLRAGAHGYANKVEDPMQLITAVHTLMQGHKYLTAEVAQLLADSLTQPAPPKLGHQLLSEREMQTLVKIASGKRLSDIAEELMLSPKTISVYRARVLEKLGLANNAELTVYAIRNQLV